MFWPLHPFEWLNAAAISKVARGKFDTSGRGVVLGLGIRNWGFWWLSETSIRRTFASCKFGAKNWSSKGSHP
jgi:hypothetical protein